MNEIDGNAKMQRLDDTCSYRHGSVAEWRWCRTPGRLAVSSTCNPGQVVQIPEQYEFSTGVRWETGK